MKQTRKMNRGFRMLIIGLAGLFGGLFLYAISGNIGWLGGQIGAGLWFIGCAWLAAYIAHRLLPVADNSDLVTESMFIVSIDDTGVSCTRPDGETEKLSWENLKRVEIITTNGGPWEPDVFWVLHGDTSGCLIPNGATGEQAMIERFQKLPKFDDRMVIKAMGSTSNNSFLVWEK